jgi:hypothetical protein
MVRVVSCGAYRLQEPSGGPNYWQVIPVALMIDPRRALIVMVGEGPPSMSFIVAINKNVDGGPSPTMTMTTSQSADAH